MRPEIDSPRDLFAAYRKAPKAGWSKGRTCKNSPHLQFANADTDDKLITFVKQFGPVLARSVREQLSDGDLDFERRPELPTIVAEQDMTELRNERLLYRSAVTMVAELKQKKPDIGMVQDCVSEIGKNAAAWEQQWHREQQLRNNNSEPQPNWHFDKKAVIAIERFRYYALREPTNRPIAALCVLDPVEASHSILCELVNAFQPVVYLWGGRPVEGPHWDLRYGVRPLLYYILRREYVVEHGGVAVCANAQCRELFDIDRAGQRFCNVVCSQRQRQRDYWAKRGKKLRTKRIRQEKLVAAEGAARRGR